MYTVLVEIRVRDGHLEEFLEGICANAAASLRDEPGCLRFDVHQVRDDPHRVVLHEVYRDREAFEVEHRRAPHYAAWREVARRTVVEGSHRNTYARPVVDAVLRGPGGG